MIVTHRNCQKGDFLRSLPGEERKVVGMEAIGTYREMLMALEHALANLDIGGGEKWKTYQEYRKEQP